MESSSSSTPDLDLTKISHIHFTGIKGVGMTAAALCFQDMGKTVSGSDVEYDFVTKNVLSQRNIIPKIGFKPENIPDKTNVLVYTGAHQGMNNPEVVAAQNRNIPTISHAHAVGLLTQSKTTISVCGVGGKTSISAMLANIFDYAGQKPSFIIGVGKVLNLQVPGKIDQGEICIAEADEYVVSPGSDNTPRFMYQNPETIICTNIAHDHPDAYPSIADTRNAFSTFFQKITDKPTGSLILNGDSPEIRNLTQAFANTTYYGLKSEGNDWWIKESYFGDTKQLVTFASSQEEIKLTLSVPGDFNAQNALAAFIAARKYGVDTKDIIQALQLFRGSMRRFEKIGEANGIVYYDDYAHHPTEIIATLKAAKQWLPLKRIVVVFQPHTFSRTKALLSDFATSFTYADQVFITDIYASEREEVDSDISAEILAQAVSQHHPSVKYLPKDQTIDTLKAVLKPGDALFTMGAGNIYQIHDLLH